MTFKQDTEYGKYNFLKGNTLEGVWENKLQGYYKLTQESILKFLNHDHTKTP